jgi:hypothetical protein
MRLDRLERGWKGATNTYYMKEATHQNDETSNLPTYPTFFPLKKKIN